MCRAYWRGCGIVGRDFIAQHTFSARSRKNITDTLPDRVVLSLSFVIESQFTTSNHRLQFVPVERPEGHAADSHDPAGRFRGTSRLTRFESGVVAGSGMIVPIVNRHTKSQRGNSQFVSRGKGSFPNRCPVDGDAAFRQGDDSNALCFAGQFTMDIGDIRFGKTDIGLPFGTADESGFPIQWKSL